MILFQASAANPSLLKILIQLSWRVVLPCIMLKASGAFLVFVVPFAIRGIVIYTENVQKQSKSEVRVSSVFQTNSNKFDFSDIND